MIVVSGIGMSLLMASLLFTGLIPLTICFAIATCSYASLSTMLLNLPADIYRSGSVATVGGLSGAGAGLGTIAATYLTGMVADRYPFAPILVVASLLPLAGVAAVLGLIRNNRATAEGIVRRSDPHLPERRDHVGPTRSGTSSAVNTPIVSIRSTSWLRCCSSFVTSSPKSARCFS